MKKFTNINETPQMIQDIDQFVNAVDLQAPTIQFTSEMENAQRRSLALVFEAILKNPEIYKHKCSITVRTVFEPHTDFEVKFNGDN